MTTALMQSTQSPWRKIQYRLGNSEIYGARLQHKNADHPKVFDYQRSCLKHALLAGHGLSGLLRKLRIRSDASHSVRRVRPAQVTLALGM
jgi:hypothetical protein